MGSSPVEDRLVERMERWLRQHGFLTKKELQLTTKYLDIPSLTRDVRPQQQVRIDLAACFPKNGTYHFIEAESDLHVFHPSLYARFAHFIYLLCPEDSIARHTPNHVTEQFQYARERGIGILTIDLKGVIRNHVPPRRQNPAPEVINVLNHVIGFNKHSDTLVTEESRFR